jgi:hypothetical protein
MAITATEQEKVGPLWAQNFSQRKYDSLALSVCADLFQVAQRTAQELFTDSTDAEARLREALTILGIPESEFYKFQKEQEREL